MKHFFQNIRQTKSTNLRFIPTEIFIVWTKSVRIQSQSVFVAKIYSLFEVHWMWFGCVCVSCAKCYVCVVLMQTTIEKSEKQSEFEGAQCGFNKEGANLAIILVDFLFLAIDFIVRISLHTYVCDVRACICVSQIESIYNVMGTHICFVLSTKLNSM